MCVGVKKISWLLSRASCPNYKKDKKEKWIYRNKRHERIVDSAIEKIRSILGDNINYIKECGVSTQVDSKVLRGRIDAVCWNENNVILIEVKSSPITRCSSQDVLQSILYKQIIIDNPDTLESINPQVDEVRNLLKGASNNKNINIRLYLVYRESNSRQKDGIVILDLSKYNLDDSNAENIMSAYSYSSQGDKKYLIGIGCFTCDNSSCPFRPIR